MIMIKDNFWLQLEVCREFQRSRCTRSKEECKFAHPLKNIEIQPNGRVTACYDSIKGRCTRDSCKYLHPPDHLKDQLLINGRNHLALKNAFIQQQQHAVVSAATQQQLPTATLTPAMAASSMNPSMTPGAFSSPSTFAAAMAAAAAASVKTRASSSTRNSVIKASSTHYNLRPVTATTNPAGVAAAAAAASAASFGSPRSALPDPLFSATTAAYCMDPAATMVAMHHQQATANMFANPPVVVPMSGCDSTTHPQQRQQQQQAAAAAAAHYQAFFSVLLDNYNNRQQQHELSQEGPPNYTQSMRSATQPPPVTMADGRGFLPGKAVTECQSTTWKQTRSSSRVDRKRRMIDAPSEAVIRFSSSGDIATPGHKKLSPSSQAQPLEDNHDEAVLCFKK